MKENGYIYEPYPSDPERDKAEMREVKLANRKKRRERLVTYCKRTIGAVAIASSIGVNHLLLDVQEGKEKVADSHPSIHFVYEGQNPEYDDVATIVATGLGTRNPTETAKKLTSHRQVGDVYALEYSNKDINIDELADVVVDMAHENDIKTLIFDGYSMGGPIELAIAAKIYKDEPDLQVSDIILNSSPIGDQGISSESQASADKLSFFINIYPDIVYSEDMRFLVEMISRSRSYWNPDELDFNFDKFKEQIHSVMKDKINNEEAASGALIAAQFMFWEKYGVDDNLETLSDDIEGKHEPRIFYTRARNPGDDTVVNIDRSRDNLMKLAKKHGMDAKIIYIDKIGHANPGDRPTEYNNAFLNEILPSIDRDLHYDEETPKDETSPTVESPDLVMPPSLTAPAQPTK